MTSPENTPQIRQEVLWPELASLEELGVDNLGGSFDRIVQIGENGRGMRYVEGDVFPLKAFLEDSKDAGSEIALGKFQAVYVRVRLPGAANDYKLVKINPNESIRTVFGLSMGEESAQYHDLGYSHVVDYLSEGNEVMMLGKPNSNGDVIEEVVVHKWGEFTNPGMTVSKPGVRPRLNGNIPQTQIVSEFNKIQAEANKIS